MHADRVELKQPGKRWHADRSDYSTAAKVPLRAFTPHAREGSTGGWRCRDPGTAGAGAVAAGGSRKRHDTRASAYAVGSRRASQWGPPLPVLREDRRVAALLNGSPAGSTSAPSWANLAHCCKDRGWLAQLDLVDPGWAVPAGPGRGKAVVSEPGGELACARGPAATSRGAAVAAARPW